jgi:hypothetical protein
VCSEVRANFVSTIWQAVGGAVVSQRLLNTSARVSGWLPCFSHMER